MAERYNFSHKLCCAMRLIDTTTGQIITTQKCKISQNKKRIMPILKPDGYYVFFTGSEICDSVNIMANGFEPCTQMFDHENAGDYAQVIDVQMIPRVSSLNDGEFYTLQGKKKGLRRIDAVRCDEASCFVKEFNKRSKVLNLFNPHKLLLDKRYYAIVNGPEKTFEAVEIKTRLAADEIVLYEAPKKAMLATFTLNRRVFGQVEAGGDYMLRLRKSIGEKWLVRYVLEDEEEFKVLSAQEQP